MVAANQRQDSDIAPTPRRRLKPAAGALRGVALGLALLGSVAGGLVACSPQAKVDVPASAVTPPPAITGPEIFQGTIGSFTQVQGLEPVLVSGYGFVVGLRGTGSAEVPAFLRQWLITEMRRQGVGSTEKGLDGVTTEGLLRSSDTTAVRLEGLIPPGAVVGTHFDILVSALDSQTTSLEGGKLLFPFDLAVAGADPSLAFSRPLARADGHLYLDPLDPQRPEQERFEMARRAVILGGGRVSERRDLYLALNQPSATRARQIADRINERFPHERAAEFFNTAVPLSESLIQINVPLGFSDQPLELLTLASKLYLQRTAHFEEERVGLLADWLEKDPSAANCRQVMYALHGLGAPAVPQLRQRFYAHANRDIRFVGLEAGARIGDERVTEALADLVQASDPALRRRSCGVLTYLPRSLRGVAMLQALLDDPDTTVRLAAYDALARMNDPMIQRRALGGAHDFKCFLDLVPAKTPLLYVVQQPVPTLVIFGVNTGFTTPTFGRMWDHRLMIRAQDGNSTLNVYYQSPLGPGQTFEIAPTIANLVLLMAQTPSDDDPTPGLDLSFGEIVTALDQLCRQGQITAPMQLSVSPLAQAVAQARRAQDQGRPEISATQPAATQTGSATQPAAASPAPASGPAPTDAPMPPLPAPAAPVVPPPAPTAPPMMPLP